MSDINSFLLAGAVLMFAGIVLGASSSRFGIPFLLIFLFVGMLAGVDGPGGIQFDNYYLSFLVGNLALAIILLDGGLRTQIATFRVALKPSLVLATVGVLVTAGLVALFAMLVLDLDWYYAFLLGSIIGSTDAAAVFSLLRASGTRLNDRVSNTLEIESGINDPMVIFLTISLIELIQSDKGLSIPGMLMQLAEQFGIGALFGVGFGYLLSRIFGRIYVSEGLQALLLCSGGVGVFALTNISGGSGFLAIYLVGLVVGNYRLGVGENVFRAMDGMAWLGQSGMFLLLGLLVTPSEMMPVAVPALAVAIFLMLVARPVAVWLSIYPFRFTPRETVFMSWVGLRGAVPIVMAVFPLLAGVNHAHLIFNVAFMVVLMSLLLQGTSIPLAARWLKVAIPGKAEPLTRTALHGLSDERFDLVEYRVSPQAAIVGAKPLQVTLPEGCRLVMIARGKALLDPIAAEDIRAGDVISLIAPDQVLDQLSEIFHAQDKSRKAVHEFYGDFILEGDALLGDVALLYGNSELHQGLQSLTLDHAMRRTLGRHAVQGDAVQLCGLLLMARRVESGNVKQVGMKLPRAPKKAGE
jgi:cell volume regulation protein A